MSGKPGNNADETLLRKDTKRGSDGKTRLKMTVRLTVMTVIRGRADASAGAHNETAIREDTTTKGNLEENQQVASSDDATIILGAEEDHARLRMTRRSFEIKSRLGRWRCRDDLGCRNRRWAMMMRRLSACEQLETDDATIVKVPRMPLAMTAQPFCVSQLRTGGQSSRGGSQSGHTRRCATICVTGLSMMTQRSSTTPMMMRR